MTQKEIVRPADYAGLIMLMENGFKSEPNDIYSFDLVADYFKAKYLVEGEITPATKECDVVLEKKDKETGEVTLYRKHISGREYAELFTGEWDHLIRLRMGLKPTNKKFSVGKGCMYLYNEEYIRKAINSYYNLGYTAGAITQRRLDRERAARRANVPLDLGFTDNGDGTATDQYGRVFKTVKIHNQQLAKHLEDCNSSIIIPGISNPAIGKYYERCDRVADLLRIGKYNPYSKEHNLVKFGRMTEEEYNQLMMSSALEYEIVKFGYAPSRPVDDETVASYIELTDWLKRYALLDLILEDRVEIDNGPVFIRESINCKMVEFFSDCNNSLDAQIKLSEYGNDVLARVAEFSALSDERLIKFKPIKFRKKNGFSKYIMLNYVRFRTLANLDRLDQLEVSEDLSEREIKVYLGFKHLIDDNNVLTYYNLLKSKHAVFEYLEL